MTTTREDREAAVRLLAAEPVSATVHRDMAYWIANAVWPGPCLVGKSVRGEHAAFAEALSKHRVASTQALREAAERVTGQGLAVLKLAAEVERLRADGAGNRLGMALDIFGDALDALRSALSPSPAQGGAAVPAVAAPDPEDVATLRRWLADPLAKAFMHWRTLTRVLDSVAQFESDLQEARAERDERVASLCRDLLARADERDTALRDLTEAREQLRDEQDATGRAIQRGDDALDERDAAREQLAQVRREAAQASAGFDAAYDALRSPVDRLTALVAAAYARVPTAQSAPSEPADSECDECAIGIDCPVHDAAPSADAPSEPDALRAWAAENVVGHVDLTDKDAPTADVQAGEPPVLTEYDIRAALRDGAKDGNAALKLARESAMRAPVSTLRLGAAQPRAEERVKDE